ncbi:MAG TPA: YqiJ family protein [Steroidobacter sp.]|uniref:YqiJ family protein n=1 Tax=Steroidobacter sp. TaxID=1978227 RepID=UPI002ED801DC
MLFAVETWPFTVASGLLLLIAIIECLAMVVGASLSQSLQQMFPEGGEVAGPFDKVLDWLSVGRVPLLVLVILFLACFALAGFALNLIVHSLLGFWAPTLIAAIVAFVVTLPMVRLLGAGVARLIPQDETYAVSFESLVGRVATIVTGTARPGFPAQAKVANEHGQMLYVMVEPEAEGMTFQSGERVLLTKQLAGNRFAGAVNPWPDLI